MEFRVLGPLEVRDNDEALVLGGAKQRSLLAILLLNANQVVSTDRLIDELWGSEAPETAAKALQGHVSQLRKALEPDRDRGGAGRVVITRSPGYLMRVGPGQLDIERFERAAAAGRAALAAGQFAGASVTLREALELWRGPPLSEFEYARFAQSEIARLEDLRLDVVEDQIQADIELGRHPSVIGTLEKLVRENPLRERPREQLMLALYRSGRQVEALDVYRDARRALVDELGIEPGRKLRELETAILEQDPSLEAPAVQDAGSPERRPAASGGESQFVGREAELRDLEAALAAASAGQGGLVMVGGEPGIGKSRLVGELSERARALDAEVVWGRCWEAGGAPAYWPWVQAIRAYGRRVDRSALQEQLAGAGDEVGYLLPEFRDLLPGSPVPDAPDSDSARFRLFDATSSFLRRAAEARPLMLVLEDLHAADAPSMLLLQFVAGELPASRLLVVGTYRDIEVTPDHPLSSTLNDLNRQPATRMVALRGVEPTDVSRLIASIAGAAPSAKVAKAIHAGTGGNPLFIGELVRLLTAEGRLDDPIDERGVRLAIPRGVRDVIGRRLDRLSEATRELLTVASVLGRDFEIEPLALSVEQPTESVLALLDGAIERGLVAEDPGTRYGMRFSHVLLRDALYDGIGAGRRTQLHRRIGEALGRMYAVDPEPHLAELAYHYYEAGPSGDARKAFEYARAAARRAARQLAHEEAVRLYRLANRVKEAGAPVDEAEACDLMLELGDAHLRAGNAEDARATFLAAAGAARELGSPTSLARAAVGYGGRYVWMASRGDPNMIPLLEEALAGLGDGDEALRVRVMARLSCAIRDQPFRERRLALSAEAVELAQRVGGFELAYALDARCLAIVGPDSVEEFGATATEVVRTGRQTGSIERELIGHLYRVMYALETANSAGGREALAAAGELAEATREPALRWYPACLRAAVALFEGRFDDAAELIPHAYGLGREALRFSPPVAFRLQMLMLHLERGNPPYVDEPIRELAAQYPGYAILGCGLARALIAQGRVTEARAVFDELAADDFAAIYLDEEYLAATTLLTDVCERLGDHERAITLYGMLLPRGSLNAFGFPELILGSVERPLGVLAAMNESWEKAEDHFVQAVEANSAMGARPWVAHAQHDHGRMLAARSASGDGGRARDLLAASESGYGELGMSWWQAESRAARDAIPV